MSVPPTRPISMNSLDLAFTPALEQARLIRQGEVSPLALTSLYLDRIERLNPHLGAYFTVMAEAAIADAQTKTEFLATHPHTLPPFFGVPISLKDLNPLAGVPCSYGLGVARDRVAQQDDGVIAPLRQAGFIFLGKTATAQLGTLPYTEPPGFPPARNPWNRDYTPGGSTGGGAAALAAGLCAIAQGSDGGGSLRGPAAACGLVGLKPSRGRVSMAPVGERLQGLASNGPLGRTVADAAALLDVMAGYVVGDPYWLPDPDPSFLALSQQPPPPLRVGLLTQLDPLGAADPICAEATITIARHLESLGHTVEPVTSPDFGPLIDPFTVVWQGVLAEANVPWFVLEKMNRWLLWQSWRVNTGAYLRAVAKLEQVSRQLVAYFAPYDLLVLPTYLHPTIAIGAWRHLPGRKTLDRIIHWIGPCPPFNATGHPALSIPAGFDPQGLPLGVQLVSRPGADGQLLAVAAQLEAIAPWHHHRPPLESLT